MEPRAPGMKARAAGSGWAEGRQHRLRSKLRNLTPHPHPLPHLPRKFLTVKLQLH